MACVHNFLLWLLCCAALASGQLTGTEEKAAALKSDIPFIRCQVCQNLIREVYRVVKRSQDELNPGKKVLEEEIMELMESVCDPDLEPGHWIAKTDLQENGAELKLVDMDQVGDCGVECRTVARVCTDLLETIDMDLVEQLYKGKKRAELTSKFCHIATTACKEKAPPLPKDRPVGEAFKALDEKDIEMKKLMKQMKDMGMGGQMFNREELMDQMGSMEDQIKDIPRAPHGSPEEKDVLKPSLVDQALDLGASMYESVKGIFNNIISTVKEKLGTREEL